jgi:hypothetical protein
MSVCLFVQLLSAACRMWHEVEPGTCECTLHLPLSTQRTALGYLWFLSQVSSHGFFSFPPAYSGITTQKGHTNSFHIANFLPTNYQVSNKKLIRNCIWIFSNSAVLLAQSLGRAVLLAQPIHRPCQHIQCSLPARDRLIPTELSRTVAPV